MAHRDQKVWALEKTTRLPGQQFWKKNFETGLGGPCDYLATTGGALVLAFGQHFYHSLYYSSLSCAWWKARHCLAPYILLERGLQSQANPQGCLAKWEQCPCRQKSYQCIQIIFWFSAHNAILAKQVYLWAFCSITIAAWKWSTLCNCSACMLKMDFYNKTSIVCK